MKNRVRTPKPKTRRTKTKTVKREKSGSDRPPAQICHLRLYVADETPMSLTAIANLKRICEDHLKRRHRIEVIDLMAQPHFAKGDRIRATPTLVRKHPKPTRRIIGDLSDTETVLLVLDLRPADRSKPTLLPDGSSPAPRIRQRKDAPR
jgi:circadian clock protein KaiB